MVGAICEHQINNVWLGVKQKSIKNIVILQTTVRKFVSWNQTAQLQCGMFATCTYSCMLPPNY